MVDGRGHMPESGRDQEKTYAMLCHLLALAGYVVPFGNLFGPLVIWLMKKDEFASVDENGKESLNFQISVTIYAFVAGILCFVVIGIPLLIGLLIAQLVFIIIASVKVNNGESYRYPATIRLLK